MYCVQVSKERVPKRLSKKLLMLSLLLLTAGKTFVSEFYIRKGVIKLNNFMSVCNESS